MVYPKKNKIGKVNLLNIGIQFGLIISLPLIILIFIGIYIDKTIQTTPLFILISTIFSLLISSKMLYNKIKEITKDINS